MSTTHSTIAALATPLGRGGVGIVRVSGPLAAEIAVLVLGVLPETRHAHFCAFKNKNGEIIDEGIALFFKSPHSFTGEDVLELQGHGGPVVQNQLLTCVLQAGAQLARAGQFSERAFLNGKMDLTQAEAVADLIAANSEQAARCAIRSLQGAFSKHIQQLLQQCISLRVFVESAIDFPEEDIDFIGESQVLQDLESLQQQMANTLVEARQGVLLREGMTVVIAGKPNVGKSSLLNCLVGKEAAIVTDIAGTTRDTLREYIHIEGMPIHVIDTAGLRETDDVIEKEGIRRAWVEINNADLLLLLVDVSVSNEDDITFMLRSLQAQLPPSLPVVIVENKIDRLPIEPAIHVGEKQTRIKISAKHQLGIDLLKKYLLDVMGFQASSEGQFIARARHTTALAEAQAYLDQGMQQLKSHRAAELLAEDLRMAQQCLAKITGEFSSDDLLGEIFSTFCIGK